jgi:Protein of unknown function, DUF547
MFPIFSPRSFLVLFFALTLGACSTVVTVPGTQPLSGQGGTGSSETRSTQRNADLLTQLAQAEQGFAKVLSRYVDERGRVGFAMLATDTSDAGLPALEKYVSMIAQVSLSQVPEGAPRLAHMINAYNALSMYNVIRSGLPATHAGLAKVRFFLLRKFHIGDQLLSLYSFENDIIRKLNEPRIHFALNCSALSCPYLPLAPFAASTLNESLDTETRKFFANPANLRIDHERRTVFFNEILKFYTEDFTPSNAPSLIAYAQRYTSVTIPPDYATAFSPYDWTVAHRPK